MNLENEAYKRLWDSRYAHEDYAYGQLPNLFFKQQLDRLKVGSILLPAEGEGRNAVYAALRGWNVTAFDISKSGKAKAMQLASAYNVSINYLVGDGELLGFEGESFDVVGLIYAHFLAPQKHAILTRLSSYLKKDGTVIFEAFGKGHLARVKANPKVGGAMPENMLYSTEEVEAAFKGYDVRLLEETAAELEEGLYHNGTAAVVRFLGTKL